MEAAPILPLCPWLHPILEPVGGGTVKGSAVGGGEKSCWCQSLASLPSSAFLSAVAFALLAAPAFAIFALAVRASPLCPAAKPRLCLFQASPSLAKET